MGTFNRTPVNKFSPCPICNHSDWCYWWHQESGDVLVCNRDKDNVNRLGADGKYYVLVGHTKNGMSIYEEADQLKQKKEAAAYVPVKKELKNIDTVNRLSNSLLNQYYRELLSMLRLDTFHRMYLRNEGWSDDLINRHMIRSLPVRDYIRFRYGNFKSLSPSRRQVAQKLADMHNGTLEGMPGAFLDKTDRWTLAGPSGILFPLYDPSGNLYGLRIRMDFTDVPEKLSTDTHGLFYEKNNAKHYVVPFKGTYTITNGEVLFDNAGGKYRPFQSWYEDKKAKSAGFIKNIYEKGCRLGDQISLYTKPGDQMYVAYLTEGEKKGIFANNALNAPILSTPGVSNWGPILKMIPDLKRLGIKMIVIAYDSDKNSNAQVLQQQNNVAEALRREGFFIGVANWQPQYGKGLDDLLARGHRPDYELI